MAIPLPLQQLIDQLNSELDESEQQATEGLNLVRGLLSRFPNNALLIQFFAYLNTVIIFVENFRRRIQIILAAISTDEVTATEIQEIGEELGTLLGQVLETKIEVRRIITRLQNLS